METARPRNVVSFERSADYWRSAASRSRRAARYQDAVTLYRKARAGALDDAGLALELATTYSDMQSFTASDRVLLSLLAKEPMHCTAYLCLALNNLRRGCQTMCVSALDACMRMVGGTGPYAAQVWDMRDALYYAEGGHARGARAAAFARTSARLYASGKREEAIAFAKRACERTPGATEYALLATLLAESDKPREALPWALRALEKAPDTLNVCLLASDIEAALGRMPHAKAALMRAEKRCRTQADLYGFCVCAERAEELPRAKRLLEKFLAETPHATDVMWLLAAVYAKLGDGVRAAATLDRLLALDPGDEVARYFAKGRSAMLPLEHALPGTEIRRRALHALASVSAQGFAERYQKSEELRRDVLALFLLGEDMQKYAAGLLFARGDADALRESLLLSLAPGAQRVVVERLILLGEKPPFLIKSGDAFALWPPEPQQKRDTDDGLRALTHFLALWLSGTVDYPVVRRLTRDAWLRLPAPCRAHCRAQQDDVYPMAFALHILSCTGQTHKTQELVKTHPLKKRISRALTLLRSGTHEMHRL